MNKRTNRWVFWAVCICLLSLFVWTVQPVAAKDKKEIVIGCGLPLSGALAMVGVDQKWAYDQAVNDINKAGGIYVKEYGKKLPVKLIVMDDETDPGKAAATVERLIKRTKVDLLLSGQTGPLAVIPGLITAEKYKKYYHATTIWIPDFLKHNFQWGTMYFFDPVQGMATYYQAWNAMPEDQRPKRPALFMEDTSDGQLVNGLLKDLAGKYGYQIALEQSLGFGAKDYSSQILKAKSADVDAVLLFANPSDCVTLLRQIKQMKLDLKFFGGWKGTWANEFYTALGKDAEYVLADGFWSMDYPFPGAKELGERYYKDHGKYSVSVGEFYALCQILFQAIEKAGSLDGQKIRQAVLDNQFDTMMGKVDYDEKGVAVFIQAAFQWINGKQQLIYPFEYATTKAKPAPPWDKR
jgi:branched-chain amino acid transport system substrate-binding protein